MKVLEEVLPRTKAQLQKEREKAMHILSEDASR